MFKVDNKANWRRSGVFIFDFEYISHFFLVFLLLTLSRSLPAGYVTETLFDVFRC